MKTSEYVEKLRGALIEDLLAMKMEDVDPMDDGEFNATMDDLVTRAKSATTLTELYRLVLEGGWTLEDLPYLIHTAVCDDWHDVPEGDALVPPSSEWST